VVSRTHRLNFNAPKPCEKPAFKVHFRPWPTAAIF
jgi:hypothetical protein